MHAYTNDRLNKTRLDTPPAVAPVTRAIRAALAISATLLALGGSGSAIAQGTCSFTTPTMVSCEGVFTNSLPDPSLFTPVTDLTLVLGDSTNSVPTSVIPAASLMGIDANWAGSVGVTSYADITTQGADGIFADSASTATVNNQGSITTNVTAPGAAAMDVHAYGDVNVVNNGSINAYSAGVYDVTAVNAYSTNGNVAVDNQVAGTITATAQDGNAIAVNAYSAIGEITATNEGAIAASSAFGIAVGVLAEAPSGSVSETNSGSITATSSNYQALGILASSGNGYASVTNSGTVTAAGGQIDTIGIEASGYTGAEVQNTGNVTATSTYGMAIGIQAQTYNGSASVTNGGSIESTSSSQYQSAIGAFASSVNGQASITNTGYVRAINATGMAIGLEVYSNLGDTSIINSGNAGAVAQTGSATALQADSVYGNVSVSNNAGGNVLGVAQTGVSAVYGTASYGIGISAESTHGDVSVTNDGAISGESLSGVGIGIRARAGGNVDVTNAAYASTAAEGVHYGTATGIYARSTGGVATVVNGGSVTGYTIGLIGTYLDRTVVTGIKAVGLKGVSVTNTGGGYGNGVISARGAWYANGVYTGSYGGTTITNSKTGSINASAMDANGIYALESIQTAAEIGTGNVTVDNAGHIAVTQFGDAPGLNLPGFFESGTGIKVYSSFAGDISVTNSGSIAIDTSQAGSGISAVATIGKVSENNSGSIALNGSGGGVGKILIGESADTVYSPGGVNVVNSGDITITAAPVIAGGSPYASSSVGYGISGAAGRAGSTAYKGGGDAIVLNTGHVSVVDQFSYGMGAESDYGTAKATNSGDITVNGFVAVGMTAIAGSFEGPDTGLGALIYNSGTLNVTATNNAIGLRELTLSPTVVGNVPFEIFNSGDVAVTAQVRAEGVDATIFNSDPLTVNNSGSIYVDAPINTRTSSYLGARGNAVGVHTDSYGGLSTITNSGAIAAVTHEDSQNPGSASGVFMISGYYNQIFGNTVLENTGSISASLISSNASQAVRPRGLYFGDSAFGPSNTATGIFALNTYGDMTITNAGPVTASAQSDHYAGGGTDKGITVANGISTVSFMGDYISSSGGTFAAGDISVANQAGGSISATAESSYASGDTAIASGISARVLVGSYGSTLLSAGHGIAINNAGTVSATALIANDPTGLANATGISATNGSTAGYADVTNSGTITATATTTGAATATGIFASGYNATAALNAGSVISAIATGASGAATGLSLINTGTGPLITNNDGVLTATFMGTGKAYGAMITSAGDVTLSNTGHILASNAVSAVGVAFNSPTAVTLSNSGTITADAAAAGSVAVLSTGASNATLNNSGTISGAIQTGAGNDGLVNAVGGIWNAVGASDFGAGDDTVSNAGTINLNNTTISLGSDPAGNQFTNTGTVTVLGNNTITMDTGTPVNPNPFTNSGTINFQNGTANNTLTIAGNFAGKGQIDMDVDGAHGTGDQLKINGNVAAGSVSTVNVNLLTDPTTASTIIPLVQVSGTSAAGSFVLGQFTQPKGFLGLSESLVSTPNTTSLGLTVATTTTTTPPPTGVGVGVTVNGLSQLGTLAASAAPGVQSLMNSQIGTLEDRMGAASQTIKGGLSLWTRVFADSGTVSPNHSAGNFGQNGNFGFDQSNSGEELGLDFAISDELKAGALFAKSRANQSLDGNQADSGHITGDTSGVYGTWISSSGFYLDASYRWMTFNDRLHAPTGYASIHGNADAFNLEAGKTWKLSNGLQIAPQFQYTLTKVDNINAQTGNLAGFQSTGDDASRARLGVMFSKEYTPTSSNAVWMPYASLSVVQELDGKNSYAVNNAFFGETNTKGTSVLAETGVNVQLGKLALFGGLNWQDGGALKSFFGGQVGLRYTF